MVAQEHGQWCAVVCRVGAIACRMLIMLFLRQQCERERALRQTWLREDSGQLDAQHLTYFSEVSIMILVLYLHIAITRDIYG